MSAPGGHTAGSTARRGTARNAARARVPARRPGVLAAVAAASAAVLVAAVVTAAGPAVPRVRLLPRSGAVAAMPQRGSGSAGPAARPSAFPLPLTAFDRRSCPAAAAACVDLAHRLTWLQSGGRITFGPVRMEPGPPGTAHATPRGTFHVAWKAGPHYVSTIYHDPMPWATFFAAGGIAFHGGSLTAWSHGCVHLTVADARHYSAHLPVGAEVVVF